MTQIELTKALTYLGTAYDKEYTKVEVEQYYDFFKDYSYDILIKAIKNTIKKSKFLPKISELIEECNKSKEQLKIEILKFMKEKGYFACENEYDKTILFIEKNIIPQWFKEDMLKYYQMMTSEREQLQFRGNENVRLCN